MRRIVLVGAGHVHMALLAQAGRFSAAGIELQLVTPGRFWYGARVAPMLAGHLHAKTLRQPLHAWCDKRGVALRSDRAVGLDTKHRRIWLASGGVLEYDAVSLNVGQEAMLEGYDAREHDVRVWDGSAVSAMAQLREALKADRASAGRRRIAVVGGDAGAAAIVAGLSAGDLAPGLDLSVYVPGARLLEGAPVGAGRRLARLLARRGVDLVFDTTIDGVTNQAVYSRDGRWFATDHVVVAADYRARRFIHASGLAAESDGLYVTRRLHAPADERVFAAGGCARLTDGPLPLQDVCSQARVLAHNLRACLTRRPYRTYRSSGGMTAVDLVDGSAIGWSQRLWWHGAAVARMKARRDKRFAYAWQ